MSDTKNPDHGAKLTLKGPQRLELKKTIGSGQVRQSFSRGRTKAVTVEVKKKRVLSNAPGAAASPAPATPAPTDPPTPDQPTLSVAAQAPEAEAAAPAPAAIPEAPTPTPSAERPAISRPGRGRVVLKTLTTDEKAARAKALDGARQYDEDVRRKADEAAKVEQAETARAERERAEAEHRITEEASRKKEEEEARVKGEQTAAKRLPETAAKEEPEAAKPRRGRPVEPRRPAARRPGGQQRRRGGRMTMSQALNDEERVRSLSSVRRAREREKRALAGTEPEKIVREVVVPETITVQELANRMAERSVDVVKALMRMGVMATPTADLDPDTAELIVSEFGHKLKRVAESDVEIGIEGDEDTPESLLPRAPIVTVMGHVDHGKTSLLDALRKTDVAAGEAGGITQHIGAYQVEMSSGAKITFLDTPGHEAFTSMRLRGAMVTDIVVLVVAADDGLMPQTIEAIRHAKEAEVPVIVAINKIDLPGADPKRVRQDLLQHELVVEEMGGDVLAVEVSAKESRNLDKLEEAILLQAELLELKANPDRAADGSVVEARIDTGRGPVATVLVKRGTLRVGDTFVAGGQWGRVRAMIDEHGQKVTEAGPSVPVEILGLTGAPDAGDEFSVVANEAKAREIADYRNRRSRSKIQGVERASLDQIFEQIKDGEASEFTVLIKADVQGSLEAIIGAANKMSNDEVKVRVVHGAVGGINESDVSLAGAAGAVIFGFNVRANAQARQLAKRDGIDVRYYSVIYEIIEDFTGVLTGMLAPTIRETMLGNAEILEVFNVSKVGKIAGCRVTDGLMRRGAKVRLLRDDVVIHEGDLATLKRFKDEVNEVKSGMECGMSFERYQDLKQGDVIEAFELEEIARTLAD
jgi:translation initiation factor IF-2